VTTENILKKTLICNIKKAHFRFLQSVFIHTEYEYNLGLPLCGCIKYFFIFCTFVSIWVIHILITFLEWWIGSDPPPDVLKFSRQLWHFPFPVTKNQNSSCFLCVIVQCWYCYILNDTSYKRFCHSSELLFYNFWIFKLMVIWSYLFEPAQGFFFFFFL
jgi:hypothetical protein